MHDTENPPGQTRDGPSLKELRDKSGNWPVPEVSGVVKPRRCENNQTCACQRGTCEDQGSKAPNTVNLVDMLAMFVPDMTLRDYIDRKYRDYLHPTASGMENISKHLLEPQEGTQKPAGELFTIEGGGSLLNWKNRLESAVVDMLADESGPSWRDFDDLLDKLKEVK